MGLFGILYGIFTLGSSTIGKIKKSATDIRRQNSARESGDIIYYSSNGLRMTNNNKLVRRKTTEYGDDVITDLYTGKVYRNLSEEKRYAQNLEAKKKGATVVRDSNGCRKIKKYQFKNQCGGCSWYRDVKTNEYFSKVCVNGIFFYMDYEGYLVRIADDSPTINTHSNLKVEEIIEIFNQRQINIRTDQRFAHKMHLWVKDFYFIQGRYSYYIGDDKKFYIITSHNYLYDDSKVFDLT